MGCRRRKDKIKWSEKVTNDEVKAVGRITQLLYDLRNRRRCYELKEEAEDRKRRKRQFINRTYKGKIHVIFRKFIEQLNQYTLEQ